MRYYHFLVTSFRCDLKLKNNNAYHISWNIQNKFWFFQPIDLSWMNIVIWMCKWSLAHSSFSTKNEVKTEVGERGRLFVDRLHTNLLIGSLRLKLKLPFHFVHLFIPENHLFSLVFYPFLPQTHVISAHKSLTELIQT